MTLKPLSPPSPKNKQIKEYLDAAQKGRTTLFIGAHANGWMVRSVEEPTPKIFSTKDEAASYAEKSKRSVVWLSNLATQAS